MFNTSGSVEHVANRKRDRYLGVWISEEADKWIEERRAKTGQTRSDLVREMLRIASIAMPKVEKRS